MSNPAQGLKIKPSAASKDGFQQSYPQFLGVALKIMKNQ
jgi:hypothetical protein